MNILTDELRPIAIDYLFPGMRVTENIYNHDGSVLLVGKGTILTEKNLKMLKRFNSSTRNISVYATTYQALLDHNTGSPELFSQEYLEEAVGYGELKSDTENLLEQIKNSETVSKEQSQQVASGIAQKLQSTDPSLILQCINAPKPIDEYLHRHSVNVSFLNGLIGKWLELPEEDIATLTLAGLLHDIGKTKIPSEIVDFPGKLSPEQFEIMKMHTIYSFELIQNNPLFSESIRLIARHHHEKMNGSGYPDGLKGDNISYFARITAVSDIYDAMVSKRQYKEAQSPFAVMSQLSTEKFSGLDMQIVSVFIERMPMELIGKPVLLTDGSIGKIRFITPNDLGHPLIEINGKLRKTDDEWYCKRMVQ
ncbi:MAG: HD domain-containing protein [Oscillospiraceae bacterium]